MRFHSLLFYRVVKVGIVSENIYVHVTRLRSMNAFHHNLHFIV